MFAKSLLLALLPTALAAPLLAHPRGTQVIPNKYIVKMKVDASQADLDAAKALLTNAPDHEYGFGGFNGFAGTVSAATVTKLQQTEAVRILTVSDLGVVAHITRSSGSSKMLKSTPRTI